MSSKSPTTALVRAWIRRRETSGERIMMICDWPSFREKQGEGR